MTNVSTDTLRHYECLGVLPRPARTTAGYRQYPAEAANRVRLVRVLRERDRGGAPCRQVHALAVEKLAQLDRKIGELTELRAQLQMIVRDWGGRLGKTPAGQRAGLLETLIGKRSEKENRPDET